MDKLLKYLTKLKELEESDYIDKNKEQIYISKINYYYDLVGGKKNARDVANKAREEANKAMDVAKNAREEAEQVPDNKAKKKAKAAKKAEKAEKAAEKAEEKAKKAEEKAEKAEEKAKKAEEKAKEEADKRKRKGVLHTQIYDGTYDRDFKRLLNDLKDLQDNDKKNELELILQQKFDSLIKMYIDTYEDLNECIITEGYTL
jgi:flagellar biosynthesis GTPase FlhF